jgi:shikimate dehydrogenase
METVRKRFGLLGRNISYSFSKDILPKIQNWEFRRLYVWKFDLTSLDEFSAIANTTDLKGINVTIPYKEAIMLHLDSLSKKQHE